MPRAADAAAAAWKSTQNIHRVMGRYTRFYLTPRHIHCAVLFLHTLRVCFSEHLPDPARGISALGGTLMLLFTTSLKETLMLLFTTSFLPEGGKGDVWRRDERHRRDAKVLHT